MADANTSLYMFGAIAAGGLAAYFLWGQDFDLKKELTNFLDKKNAPSLEPVAVKQPAPAAAPSSASPVAAPPASAPVPVKASVKAPKAPVAAPKASEESAPDSWAAVAKIEQAKRKSVAAMAQTAAKKYKIVPTGPSGLEAIDELVRKSQEPDLSAVPVTAEWKGGQYTLSGVDMRELKRLLV